MKFRHLLTVLGLFAWSYSSQATEITIDSTLDSWGYWGPGPGDFSEYADVARGDAVSLKINFSDSLVGAANTNPVLFAGGVASIEYSIGGILRLTFTDLNVTLRNDYNSADRMQILATPGTTVTGMMASYFVGAGKVAIDFYDIGGTGLTSGGPVDYAKFFDEAGDAFASSIGFLNLNPYIDDPWFDSQAGGGTLRLAQTPASGVPDSASTFALTLFALASLAGVRSYHSKRKATA